MENYLSIVIPALNEEKYLPLLLKDLRAQTFQNFEVIVVNGMSEDKTKEIAMSFEKVKVFDSVQRNASVQRNIGANTARYDTIIFFDADNRIPKYFLEGLNYRINSSNPDVFSTWISDEGVDKLDLPIVRLFNIALDSYKVFKYPIMALGSMIGCKKSVFKKIKGFDITMKYAEDTDFVSRAIKSKFKYIVFKDPSYNYSLRRYQKEGVIKIARDSSEILLERLFYGKSVNEGEKYYPMKGGSYYDEKESKNELVKFYKKFKKELNINKLKEYLDDLL